MMSLVIDSTYCVKHFARFFLDFIAETLVNVLTFLVALGSVIQSNSE